MMLKQAIALIGLTLSLGANAAIVEAGKNPQSWCFSVFSVPIPSAAWLFGSGLIGLVGMRREARTTNSVAKFGAPIMTPARTASKKTVRTAQWKICFSFCEVPGDMDKTADTPAN
jgi:hypothetical protein